jgi:hypothetical protein
VTQTCAKLSDRVTAEVKHFGATAIPEREESLILYASQTRGTAFPCTSAVRAQECGNATVEFFEANSIFSRLTLAVYHRGALQSIRGCSHASIPCLDLTIKTGTRTFHSKANKVWVSFGWPYFCARERI